MMILLHKYLELWKIAMRTFLVPGHKEKMNVSSSQLKVKKNMGISFLQAEENQLRPIN
jgi:hypothetical protein